jgi:hypothetical protein
MEDLILESIVHNKRYKENPFKEEMLRDLSFYKDSIEIDNVQYTTRFADEKYIPYIQITESGIDSGLKLSRPSTSETKTTKGAICPFLYFMIMKVIFRASRERRKEIRQIEKIFMPIGLMIEICDDLGLKHLSYTNLSKEMKPLYTNRIIAKTSYGNGTYWVNTAKLFSGKR